MRIAFMGSPRFAGPALHALLAAGHDIAAVYCQPPKPAGRGQTVRRCFVHDLAVQHDLPVLCPATLRQNAEAQADFAALTLDLAVVAAYGLILPRAMLEAPRLGCLNIHASLLPRWRGAAPIQAAILAGDDTTGVTIMQMESGLDSGPILLADSVPIRPSTIFTDLHDQLAVLGARLILRVLDNPPPALPQPDEGVCYAAKPVPADGVLDWRRPAAELDRVIRALNPWPGTRCLWRGETLKILAAHPEPLPTPALPGEVLDHALLVACGEGGLRITRLQRPGRAALEAEAFLRGTPIGAGGMLL